jgi:hypothetical protein
MQVRAGNLDSRKFLGATTGPLANRKSIKYRNAKLTLQSSGPRSCLSSQESDHPSESESGKKDLHFAIPHVDLVQQHRYAPFNDSLLDLAVNSLVAALLSATFFWLLMFGRQRVSQIKPLRASVSVRASRSPTAGPEKQSHQNENVDTRFGPTAEASLQTHGGTSSVAILQRPESSDFHPERLSQDVGLVLKEQAALQHDRIDSGSRAGPSGHESLPIIELSHSLGALREPVKQASATHVSQHQTSPATASKHPDNHRLPVFEPRREPRSDLNDREREAVGVSLATSDAPILNMAMDSSPNFVGDSGTEPGATRFSKGPSLPLFDPKQCADPFANRAGWDSGFEPTGAPFSANALQDLPTPTSESTFRRVQSGVQLCSFRRKKGNSFVRAAADRVGPSVVRLNTERSPPPEGNSRDLFSKFFGGEDLVLEDKAKDREQGQGSGFVVDGRRGILATNAHVINRADTVLVSL